MVADNIQWPTYSGVNSATERTGQSGGMLGKDQFLRILITQLQNQDPASPLQDREFIAQMAQFSSLEQMMNMTNEIKGLRQSLGIASGMIGLEAEWVTYDPDGKPAGTSTGTVDSILIKAGAQYAEVGGKQVPFTNIVGVRQPAVEPTP